MDYQPVKTRWVSPSEETNILLKRKRVLSFGASRADEWLELAELFMVDGGRANHAYCLWQYKKLGGCETGPVEFHFEPYVPEPDFTEIIPAVFSREPNTASSGSEEPLLRQALSEPVNPELYLKESENE